MNAYDPPKWEPARRPEGGDWSDKIRRDATQVQWFGEVTSQFNEPCTDMGEASPLAELPGDASPGSELKEE